MASEEPAEYQKLAIKRYPARALRETAEGKYWKQFKSPALAKQIGAVTHIDFCAAYPHHFAVTASTRVVVYDSVTRRVRRTFGRFKDKAYGGSFRADGKLLTAGGEDGVVQVFDANSRAVLRQFKGHKAAAHAARFAPDKTHVLSTGDDATVRYWDVTTGDQLCRLDGHSDYVRSAAVSPASPDTWATGGYDHVCKVWDVRQQGAVAALDHGAAIEAVAFLPSGSTVVTAGGNHVCVWDLLGGGRLLRRMGNHQKTVTCLAVAPMAGPNSTAAARLLTGSLDGHVKVYELDSFKVTHASRYSAPVLALGISPDAGSLAVGMSDGTLCVRKHSSAGRAQGQRVVQTYNPFDTVQRRPPRLTAANYRYFLRGQSAKAAEGDYRVAAQKKVQLAPYDHMLRKFRYADAVDAALVTGRPEVVSTLLEELAARGALTAALGGRDSLTLQPLLRHVGRYMSDSRHARLMSAVGHRLVDLYAGGVGADADVDGQLVALRDRVAGEVALQQQLAVVQGTLEPLLAMAAAAATPLQA